MAVAVASDPPRTTAPAPPPAVTAEAGDPRRWLILAVILAVEVMDLHTTLSQLQWVAGGYSLTFAVGLVTGGRLGDIFGRRRLFLLGVAGFTLSSAVCGLAQSPAMLIACRLVQGAFAASMIPQGFGIVRQAFPPSEIGRAFAMFGPVIGGSAVLGPIIGGALVDGNLFGTGWRMIFLVNVPLGLAALIGGLRVLPESRAAVRPTLDLAGATLVSVAAGLLIFPLIQGRTAGWPAWTYVSMAGSALVLGAFVLLERRRERAGISPLVPTSVFRRRAFSGGLASAMVLFSGVMGLLFTFSLYLQLGNGYSAIQTGLTLIPLAAGTALGAGIGIAVLGPRFGRHVLHGGVLVMAIGVGAMLAIVSGASHVVSAAALAGPELIAGAGMGAILSPLFDFVLAGVEDDEVGAASGVLNATQQLGGAAGVALVGTLFFSVAASSGLGAAFQRCLIVELAALAACGLLIFTLPMRARESEV
jgi:EmrB/QacA subfamily drug resistance transporter